MITPAVASGDLPRASARRLATRLGRTVAATTVTAVALALALPAIGSPTATLGAQAAPAVTLEQLLSTPFPTSLVAAPRGGAVAWVLNERGARNIWVATAPAYAGKRLTSYTADDGQEISALTWEPDGASLVFVRGGARNRAGESPNPAQDA